MNLFTKNRSITAICLIVLQLSAMNPEQQRVHELLRQLKIPMQLIQPMKAAQSSSSSSSGECLAALGEQETKPMSEASIAQSTVSESLLYRLSLASSVVESEVGKDVPKLLTLINLRGYLAEHRVARYDIIKYVPIEMPKADLRNIVSCAADLEQADLTGANLAHAYLPDVNFLRANLTRANLTNAKLSQSFPPVSASRLKHPKAQVSCRETTFDEAVLIETRCDSCNFDGASFKNTYAREANFSQAEFADATLERTMLLRANFSQATGLQEAQKRYAKARGAHNVPDDY